MGQTDRPDDRRAAGSRLPSHSESAVKRNHETPKSGIPKRKKIEACPRLSCKIQYLLASNHRDQSTASEYFTADSSIMDWWRHRPSAPGDVRGFDVNTGRLLWTFHTVPQMGDPNVETWQVESWRETGNANVWAPMSADEKLGYVYLPVSTPTNDFYGADRPGAGLYGESLVCLDAVTGKKIWYYQLIHHGLWDYDPPAAPNLIDITVDGKPIKAVAQVTKQAFVYVFDRVTGVPVWPIEEQPVPASSVPGERASKTQPFPSKPAPIDIQGVRSDDLIDLTPDIHQDAIDIVAKYDHGPLFTPPSERGTIQVPGVAGGGNWAGAAIDPE